MTFDDEDLSMYELSKEELTKALVDELQDSRSSTYRIVMHASLLMAKIVDERGFEDEASREGAHNYIKDLDLHVRRAKIEPQPKYKDGSRIRITIVDCKKNTYRVFDDEILYPLYRDGKQYYVTKVTGIIPEDVISKYMGKLSTEFKKI